MVTCPGKAWKSEQPVPSLMVLQRDPAHLPRGPGDGPLSGEEGAGHGKRAECSAFTRPETEGVRTGEALRLLYFRGSWGGLILPPPTAGRPFHTKWPRAGPGVNAPGCAQRAALGLLGSRARGLRPRPFPPWRTRGSAPRTQPASDGGGGPSTPPQWGGPPLLGCGVRLLKVPARMSSGQVSPPPASRPLGRGALATTVRAFL